MHCRDCKYWFRGTWFIYKNNEPSFKPVVEKQGVGRCRSDGPLQEQDVPEEFGCLLFTPFAHRFEQEEKQVYDLESWQVWQHIVCPDCGGNPALPKEVCRRCAGTGQVRKYADGYVGEEQTKEHPIERGIRLERQKQEMMEKLRAELAALEAEPEPPEYTKAKQQHALLDDYRNP